MSSTTADTLLTVTPQRIACDRCWKRKQRCDRLRPICTPCRNAGQQCQPRSTSVALTTEHAEGETIDVPCGEGYIGALKRKISRLESLHRAKRRRVEPAASQTPTPARDGTDHDDGGPEDTSLHAALGEFRHLVLSSMAAEGSSDLGQSPETSLAGLILNVAVTTQHDKSTYRKILDVPLCFSDEDCKPLLETYIEKMLWRYPAEDETSFRRSYEHVLQQHDENGYLFLNPTSPYLIIVIYLALACVGFSSSGLSSRVFAAQLHAFASKLISQHGPRMSPLQNIRCLLSFTICSLFTSEAGLTWHLVGIAMSKAISQGLHQSRANADEESPEQDGESKRLFQVLYLIDGTISMVMDRPRAIEPSDVSLRYVPEPKYRFKPSSAPENQISTLDNLIEHAQLMGCLRSTTPKPIAHYLGAYHVWHQKTYLRTQATKSPVIREVYLRSCCRALVRLLWLRQESSTNASGTIKLTQNMESETLETFRTWLDCLSEAYDAETIIPSWIDSYDITNIRTVVVETHVHHREQSLTTITTKCDALVGRLVDRFPSAKALRDVSKRKQINTPASVII